VAAAVAAAVAAVAATTAHLHKLQQHVERVRVLEGRDEAEQEGVARRGHRLLLLDHVPLLPGGHDVRLVHDLQRHGALVVQLLHEAHAAEGAPSQRAQHAQVCQLDALIQR